MAKFNKYVCRILFNLTDYKTHTIIEIVGQSHAPWVEIISMSGSYVKVGSVVALPTFTFFTPSIRSPHRYPEIAQ